MFTKELIQATNAKVSTTANLHKVSRNKHDIDAQMKVAILSSKLGPLITPIISQVQLNFQWQI